MYVGVLILQANTCIVTRANKTKKRNMFASVGGGTLKKRMTHLLAPAVTVACAAYILHDWNSSIHKLTLIVEPDTRVLVLSGYDPTTFTHYLGNGSTTTYVRQPPVPTYRVMDYTTAFTLAPRLRMAPEVMVLDVENVKVRTDIKPTSLDIYMTINSNPENLVFQKQIPPSKMWTLPMVWVWVSLYKLTGMPIFIMH